MVVDDDPDIRAIAEMSLAELGGLEVMACDSGRSAIEQLDAFGPQMVILDVMMPELDGPGTLEVMRKVSASEMPVVVFCTAKAYPSERARLEQLDVAAVLSKPFDPIALPGVVEGIWARRSLA